MYQAPHTLPSPPKRGRGNEFDFYISIYSTWLTNRIVAWVP